MHVVVMLTAYSCANVTRMRNSKDTGGEPRSTRATSRSGHDARLYNGFIASSILFAAGYELAPRHPTDANSSKVIVQAGRNRKN